VSPAPRRLPGMRTLSALLFAAVLAGGGALVWLVHAPWLRGRLGEESERLVAAALEETAAARGEDLDRTAEVLRAGTDHLVERWSRDMEDLPFELVAGDPAAVRALAVRGTAEVGAASRENARVLASEVRRRSDERMARLEAALDALRRDAADRTAGSVALSSSLLVLGLLAALLALQGFLLGRAVVRPVQRIARGAERLAAGDLAHRVEETGSREVADLAAGLNRMAASVETASAEVKALNEGLEKRVREKSAALVRAETLASLGTLAGGVAHEFNNLLGGILGTAEEALADAPDEGTRESLDLVVRTARRGCAVTENLLRFARPREPRAEPVELAALLRDAAALVQPEARQKGVVLEVRTEGAPPLFADAGEFHQVVLNLLANAVAFAPGGGRVEVTAGTGEGGAFELSVRDTGPGIPPAALPRIFEPFFTTRGSEGTGLGLAVSHGIVRAHGGVIEASNDPRGGARFTVRLPAGAPRGGAPGGAA
jgi:two-component system, NtrC family, sensor kinase